MPQTITSLKKSMRHAESVEDLPELLKDLFEHDNHDAIICMDGEECEWLVCDGDLVVDGDLTIDYPLAVTGNLVVNGVLRDAYCEEYPVLVGEDIVASVGAKLYGAWLPGGRCVTQVFAQEWAEHAGLAGWWDWGKRWTSGSGSSSGENLVALVGLYNTADAQESHNPFVTLDYRYVGFTRTEFNAGSWVGPKFSFLDEEYELLAEPFAARAREYESTSSDLTDLFDELCAAVREGGSLLAIEPGLSEVEEEARVWWPSAPEDYLLGEAAQLDRARKVALRPWPLPSPVLDAVVTTLADDRRGLLALSNRTDLPDDVRAQVVVSLRSLDR